MNPRCRIQSLLFLLVILMYGCANIVAPGGGPKDATPPKLVSAKPVSGATRVNEMEFTLDFDEFIVVKDLQKHLLVSPPPKTPPDIQAKRRSLVIKLEDSLRANTTYNIYLGSAVVDLNEGNAFKDFSYVFSTGNNLDSMELGGKLIDALTLEPVKEGIVMLYDHTGDSLPYIEMPSYVCRSGDDGSFRFRYLADKSYQLIALKEKNPNMLYDDRSEFIGFIDTLIRPSISLVDTNSKDSTRTSALNTPFEVYLSLEKDTIQRLSKYTLVNPRELDLVFQTHVNHLNIDFLPNTSPFSFLKEFNPGRDSVKIWITSEQIPDSAFLVISADQKILDTLEINMKKSEKRSRAGKDGQKSDKLSNTHTSPEPGVNNLVRLVFNYPVQSFSSDFVKLVNDKDSILSCTSYFEDSIRRRFVIRYPWKEYTSYKIIIPDSAFIGYGGQANDSIKISFTTPSEKDYGNLTLKCTNQKEFPARIELLNSAGKIISYQVLRGNGTLVFPFVKPGKYKIRAIADSNNNGIWDSGYFIKKQLPEKVIYFPRELDIRAN